LKAVVWSMSSPSQLNTARFSFSDADFAVIARFASREYGLDLKIEKKGLIYARLARRIRALGMDDFKTYCAYATGGTSRSEQSELLSALTTNVTSFFREQHHFDMLRSQILPNLGARLATGKKINLVGNWVHDVKFDIVFCRNVVIYFERATQHRLWTRFHDSMTPEGCLFIGHSERLSGPSETRFNNIGITAFEKVSP